MRIKSIISSVLLTASIGNAIPRPAQIPLAAHDLLATLALPTAISHQQQLESHIQSLPEPRRIRYVDTLDGAIRDTTISEGQKALLVYHGIKFEDVTDDTEPALVNGDGAASNLPTTLLYSKQDLDPVYSLISTKRMKTFLSNFSGFRTRYYRSSTGKESQQFLLKHIKEIVSRSKAKIEVKEFPHPWGQNSIIVSIAPNTTTKTKGKDEGVVIIGAHQDSTNLLPFLSSPGADDDGSGTTTILETLTTLVNSDFIPANHTLEFHWYSAEEGGLLGSNAVAQSYKADGKQVKAMLQLDMTAFVKPGTEERIGIIQDYVDPELTSFLEKLAKEHADIPVVQTNCGYACSDHASFSKIGARSAFAIESSFEDSNKNIHSSRDTINVDGFSFDHMAQFVKLAAAFGVELTSS